jgi:hypothetical protein
MNVTPAAENDLTVAKQFLPRFEGLEIFADKIYRSAEWQGLLDSVDTKLDLKPSPMQ